MKHTTQKSTQSGYAILFAVVVVSIISMIALGLSNTTYKQLVLSSLANDSQISYYQSDNATECALYADNVIGLSSPTFATPWNCGKVNDTTSYTFNMTGPGVGDPANYVFIPTVDGTTVPCFKFNVTKSLVLPVQTNIYAKGYNSCDSTSAKTVEREIQVYYQ